MPSLVGTPLLSALERPAEYWSWTREASVVVSFGLVCELGLSGLDVAVERG